MVSFATSDGQPRLFSLGMELTYNQKTGELRASEKGLPVFFNNRGIRCETYDLSMTPVDFIKFCDGLCMGSPFFNTRFVSRRDPDNANIIKVTFDVVKSLTDELQLA